MGVVATELADQPADLQLLRELALDLRWTWSHEGDAVWRYVDASVWEQTHNPWVLLQNTPPERFEWLAGDPAFKDELGRFAAARRQYLQSPGWFRGTDMANKLGGIAYFSMEFGLGEALPLYAGGLGMLAGDYLKTASDLDMPVVGIGLLYQEGYFRQVIGADGLQREFFPYNEPAALPIEPVIMPDGARLRVSVELPGREVELRVWQARVGRVMLYLLDSNYPLNSPADRGITARLYETGEEIRLLQEIVIGVGGWRVVETLRPDTEICHINEGHAAFAIIERARRLATKTGLSFKEALWATRAGNVFTTHTPVAAAFDRFPAELVRKCLAAFLPIDGGSAGDVDEVLAMGRANPGNGGDPFNMAFLAARGAAITVGVSRLHGDVSRDIFQPLFERWPRVEVPIGHITNGVHTPSWDSAEADQIWTDANGKERWRLPPDASLGLAGVSDEELWGLRGVSRRHVVATARRRLVAQLQQRGADARAVEAAGGVLDPNVLTLGFARRFTEYKRPNLLLSDLPRLERLLLDGARPVQLIVAGKAHQADLPGKAMIRQWIELARQPRFRQRVVFLEDYDIALAQELVQGVDLWINTPRRPWEACGTSGMKVLVNGGLNCSVRDGWWDEAFDPAVGWAVGGPAQGTIAEIDARDARSLFAVLEEAIVPEFYRRDKDGLPRSWLQRMRNSMIRLTPHFSGARMMGDYIEQTYLPVAQAVRARSADGYGLAKALHQWAAGLRSHWPGLHIGNTSVSAAGGLREIAVPIYLGEIEASAVAVQAYADGTAGGPPEIVALEMQHPIPGAMNGYVYGASLPAARPSSDYTVRVIPRRAGVLLPAELPLIAWQG